MKLFTRSDVKETKPMIDTARNSQITDQLDAAVAELRLVTANLQAALATAQAGGIKKGNNSGRGGGNKRR